LLLVASVAFGACAPTQRRFEYRELHMGCEARIVLHAADSEAAAHAARRAFDRIAALDQVLSDWREDSEVASVARVVDSAPSHPASIPVSDALAAALRCSLCMAGATDGRFDPTIGALTQLWRRSRAGSAPVQAEIDAARANTGMSAVRLDGARLIVARPGLRLDFGAIGKGIAADEALRSLADDGLPRALVEIGGDGAVGEAPPGRSAWRIVAASTGELIELAPWSGMATSGDAEQWIVIDDERHSHVMDPRAGFGATGSTTVTVVVRGDAPREPCAECGPAATADALATAVTVAAADDDDAALLARFPRSGAILVHPGEPPRVIRLGVEIRRESPRDPALAP